MKIRLLCLLTAALSTNAGAVDLMDSYRMALANDASYLSSVFEREAVARDPEIARSAWRPSVALGAEANRVREDVNSSNPATSGADNFNNVGAALSLSQRLYDRQSRISITQAELGDQRAGALLESAEDEVIIRVAVAYFSVLGALDNLELATSEKIAIRRQLELADERLNVGIGTQTDLYDASARFQLAEANEIEAENLIESALQSLVAIIGHQPDDLARLREDAPLDMPDPASVADWVSNALQNNPVLRSASVGLEIARQNVEFQRNTKHPRVLLNAQHSYADNSGGVTGSSDRTNTRVGVELSIPLYLGGSVEQQVQRAALSANAQEQQVEFTRRDVTRNIRILYNDLVSGIKRVEALDQAVLAGESAVEAKQEGFSAGLITNLDVLDAQRDLFQARRDYLRARYDFILSVLRLEQAAGTLDESDVSRVNAWLN
jgi:outer membrane protein